MKREGRLIMPDPYWKTGAKNLVEKMDEKAEAANMDTLLFQVLKGKKKS